MAGRGCILDNWGPLDASELSLHQGHRPAPGLCLQEACDLPGSPSLQTATGHPKRNAPQDAHLPLQNGTGTPVWPWKGWKRPEGHSRVWLPSEPLASPTEGWENPQTPTDVPRALSCTESSAQPLLHRRPPRGAHCAATAGPRGPECPITHAAAAHHGGTWPSLLFLEPFPSGEFPEV